MMNLLVTYLLNWIVNSVATVMKIWAFCGHIIVKTRKIKYTLREARP